MRQELEKIVNVSRILRITCNQALFLIAITEGVYTVDLPGAEMLELVQKSFMKGNQISTEGYDKVQEALSGAKKKEIEKVKADSRYPIITEDTAEITKRLAGHFLKEGLSEKEFDRLSAYNKNPIAIPFLYIFLQMFPTSNIQKNKIWNKQFDTVWEGVTLRRMTPGTARKFQEIWKKRDIGLFLLGTYLFIEGCKEREGDKYFVKKIENYLAEYEHWYNEAKDMLDAGKLDAFTHREVKRGANTIVI